MVHGRKLPVHAIRVYLCGQLGRQALQGPRVAALVIAGARQHQNGLHDGAGLDAAPIAGLVLGQVALPQVINLVAGAAQDASHGIKSQHAGKLKHRQHARPATKANARVERAGRKARFDRRMRRHPSEHKVEGMAGVFNVSGHQERGGKVLKVVHAIEHEAPFLVVVVHHAPVDLIRIGGQLERRGTALHVPWFSEVEDAAHHVVSTAHNRSRVHQRQASGHLPYAQGRSGGANMSQRGIRPHMGKSGSPRVANQAGKGSAQSGLLGLFHRSHHFCLGSAGRRHRLAPHAKRCGRRYRTNNSKKKAPPSATGTAL